MEEPLFQQHLRPDIFLSPQAWRAGARRVFPAIRVDRIDFYHRGGKLFSFDRRGFRTNLKYAAAFNNVGELDSEIAEADLNKVVCIRSFSSGYESIKRLCNLYAGGEARGVSGLYGRYPFSLGGSVFVLDIEASFDARTREAAENDQDRIDVVLMDVTAKSLMFVEAKLYTNSAIRAIEGTEPPVVAQVNRYRAQLASQRDNILSAYGRYVDGMNKLLNLLLPKPESVVPDVPLLIFDYDSTHEAGPLKTCVNVLERGGIRCLTIGNLAPNKPSTLQSWFGKA